MGRLKELSALARSTDETDRKDAALDLGDMGGIEATIELARLISDRSPSVREAAVEALVNIGGEESCFAVIPLLGSESVPERNAACEVLQSIGADALSPLVGDPLRSPNADVRKFAVDVVANMRDLDPSARAKALRAIAARLEDESENVAIAAAEALGRIGDGGSDALSLATAALAGASTWKQCALLQAIGQLAGRAHLAGLDRSCLRQESAAFLDSLLSAEAS